MISSAERLAYVNRDKDLARAKRRRTKNVGRPDVKKQQGMKKRDKIDDDKKEVTRDADLVSAARDRRASLTGEVSEFSPGQQVFPVFPVARPIIGVVVGANKVEGKVYVSYNGRVVQHDPEEIQLAAGSPYFMMAGGRVASTEGGRISELFAQASALAGPCEASRTYEAKLAIALREKGLTASESLELAKVRVAALAELKTRVACVAVTGDPVVVLNNGGRGPGIVGVMVGARGGAALVSCHTDWTSTRSGAPVREFDVCDVVPIDAPVKRHLPNTMLLASERAERVAKEISVESRSSKSFYFKNERGEAAVTVCAEDGEVFVVANGRFQGVTQCLYKDSVKVTGDFNKTDRFNKQTEVETLEQNAISAAQRFVRDKLLPDHAEQQQLDFIKKNQTMTASEPLLAFRPIDLWNIAEDAVQYLKLYHDEAAYADEQKGGVVKLFYGSGNDYLWLIWKKDGFVVDGQQITNEEVKKLASEIFKPRKIFKSWENFEPYLKRFKEKEAPWTGLGKSMRSSRRGHLDKVITETDKSEA